MLQKKEPNQSHIIYQICLDSQNIYYKCFIRVWNSICCELVWLGLSSFSKLYHTPVKPDVLYVFEREYKCSTSLNQMSDLLYFDKNSFDLFGKDAFNV